MWSVVGKERGFFCHPLLGNGKRELCAVKSASQPASCRRRGCVGRSLQTEAERDGLEDGREEIGSPGEGRKQRSGSVVEEWKRRTVGTWGGEKAKGKMGQPIRKSRLTRTI